MREILKSTLDSGLVKVDTSYGIIKLALNELISANVDASTTWGKIECDFPIYLEETRGSKRINISGTWGEGKHTIELEGNNTSIYIEKQ